MRRLAALACAVAMVASGCSYAEREPGLFPTRVPTASQAPPPRAKFLPKPTNPNLPVLGDAIWVSGGRLPVTFRFAVHAVRRIEGAAVLDWSVTPLRARGFEFGDDLPGIDLGLARDSLSDVNIALIDPLSDRVFQPLSHRSRELFNHCLCSPPWVIQQDLRIGETRLMQIAYPELPATVDARRRQPGHAGSVHPRPGEPDRHRAGGASAHQPGPVGRSPGRGHHPDPVPLSPTSRRDGRASRSIGS